MYWLLVPRSLVFYYCYPYRPWLYRLILGLSLLTLLTGSLLSFLLSRWALLGVLPLGLEPQLLFFLCKLLVPFSFLRALLALSNLVYVLLRTFRPELLSPALLWMGPSPGRPFFSLFQRSTHLHFHQSGSGVPKSWTQGHIMVGMVAAGGGLYLAYANLEELRRANIQAEKANFEAERANHRAEVQMGFRTEESYRQKYVADKAP